MTSRSLLAARLALSTALVMIATMAINIYVPATKGYFNLGETMIYLTALLFNPFMASFAGGVGSALADVALGYLIYAPATLVIKAAEGAVAGLLVRRLRGCGGKGVLAVSLAAVSGYFILVLLIGYTLFAGTMELSLVNLFAVRGFMAPITWIPVAFAAVSTPLYLTLKRRGAEGLIIIGLLVSGLVMIAGYYVYEQFILGYYALAEIPVNFGQVVLGVAAALPLYRAIEKIGGRR